MEALLMGCIYSAFFFSLSVDFISLRPPLTSIYLCLLFSLAYFDCYGTGLICCWNKLMSLQWNIEIHCPWKTSTFSSSQWKIGKKKKKNHTWMLLGKMENEKNVIFFRDSRVPPSPRTREPHPSSKGNAMRASLLLVGLASLDQIILTL